MGLPSLQALVWGGGASLLLSHIYQGGLENYLGGGVGLRGLGGCSFLCFTDDFYFDFDDIGLTKCNFKLQVCHAMLCSVVVCCGLVRCKVVSCSVV